MDWAPACDSKGHWFDSQSGHMPGLWARSPAGSWERQPHIEGFSPSLPLSLKINKIFKKRKKLEMYKVCTCRSNRKWKRKSRQSWENKSTYTDSADILLCFLFWTSWCNIMYKFYSTLFKEAATKQRQTNFEHTFNLSKTDAATLPSQFWEMSHKTYQSLPLPLTWKPVTR